MKLRIRLPARISLVLLLVVSNLVAGGAQARRAEPEFGSSRKLRYGSPRQVGLVPQHVAAIDDAAEAGLQPSPTYPHYPGAVVLAAKDGVIVKHRAFGYAYKYADDAPTLLPEDERVPMTKNTIFDLASVSKLFTSIAVMQLVERGDIDLDEPVAGYIPAFGNNGKATITSRMLLTHTSGLAAWMPLYSSYPTPEARIQAIYDSALNSEPSTEYVYSDLGMIVLGELVETVSGSPLDVYVRDNITEPLDMDDTGYNLSVADPDRIAATEYQPWTDRGMIRGSVHDENAWSLGGVAGHAGVFGTAHDLAVLGQTILNGGRYGGVRILEAETVGLMTTNFNTAFPGDDHGLGFELYQHWYMDALSTPATAGHTGFTGTSMVLNPLDESMAILLTNRVHPSREWGSINPERRAVAHHLGRAVPVRPAAGHDAWFSDLGNALGNTLDLPLMAPSGSKYLDVKLWYDTEPVTDFLAVEASADGGETWQPLRGLLSSSRSVATMVDGIVTGWGGREWREARFDFSSLEGPVTLRFRYQTDALYSGRGVYVDRVRVKSSRGVLFDDARPRDNAAFITNGWVRSTN